MKSDKEAFFLISEGELMMILSEIREVAEDIEQIIYHKKNMLKIQDISIKYNSLTDIKSIFSKK